MAKHGCGTDEAVGSVFSDATPQERFALMLQQRVDALEDLTRRLEHHAFGGQGRGLGASPRARELFASLERLEAADKQSGRETALDKARAVFPAAVIDALSPDAAIDLYEARTASGLFFKSHFCRRVLVFHGIEDEAALDEVKKIIESIDAPRS